MFDIRLGLWTYILGDPYNVQGSAWKMRKSYDGYDYSYLSDRPGGRRDSVMFFDVVTSSVCLFGGRGKGQGNAWSGASADSTYFLDEYLITKHCIAFYLNDIWCFATNWLWKLVVGGIPTAISDGLMVFGSRGIEAPAITPSGRQLSGGYYNATSRMLYVYGTYLFGRVLVLITIRSLFCSMTPTLHIDP